MKAMTISDIEQLERDVIQCRYHFVCTPQEFIGRYGTMRRQDLPRFRGRLEAAAVLCKDGMIRPR